MPDKDTSLFGDTPLFGEDIFEPLGTVSGARLNALKAVRVKPAEHAAALGASEKLVVPADVIRDAKEVGSRDDQATTLLAALEVNPVLREKFNDPDFAMLASGDVEALGKLERAIIPPTGDYGIPHADASEEIWQSYKDRVAVPQPVRFGPLRTQLWRKVLLPQERRQSAEPEDLAWQRHLSTLERPEPSVGSWLAGVADVVPRTIQNTVASLTELSVDLLETAGIRGSVTETLRGMAEMVHKDTQVSRVQRTPEFKTATVRYVYGGVESAVQFTVNMLIAKGKGNRALGLMGTETGLEAYSGYRVRGASVGEALRGGLLEGGIEIYTERIPMNFMLSRFGKVGMKSFIAGLLVREIPTEQLATFLQDMVDTAIANPNKTWGEFWAERPEAMYGTLVATVTQAGLVAGGHGIARKYVGASDALKTDKTLDVMKALAESSELAKLSPEEFKSFIDAASKKGGVKDLHITSEDLEAALEQAGVDQSVLPSDIQEQFASASVTGATIEISLGTYLSQIARTPLGEAIAPRLRKAPDALSREEAQSFLEDSAGELEQTAKDIIAKQNDMGVAKREAAAIHAFYLSQLNKANKFTKDVNALYASLMRDFYVTMSARVGVSPTELLEKYQVHVRRVEPKDDALKQLAKAGLVPAIRKDESGEILSGESGQIHAIILQEAGITNAEGEFIDEGAAGDLTAGFVDADGKFYTRGEATTKFAVQDALDTAEAPRPLLQEDKDAPRGGIALPGGEVVPGEPTLLKLAEGADLSTFLHESGHFFFAVMADIAGRKEVPADISTDLNAVFKWLGVKDLAAWKKMSLEQKRDFHEKFARGFELYLFEGKAPSTGMQAMFTRFRSWMLRVYRSMSELNVDLSDEVRSVFDRMLASEDQIRGAEEVNSFEPLFTNAKEAGLTEAEFTEYVKLPLAATDEAIRELEKRSLRNMKWLRDARSRVIKSLQKEAREARKIAREEAAEAVLNSPLYRAYAFLRSGAGLAIEEGISHRFALDALKSIDSKVWDTSEFRQRFVVKTKKGMHPDDVAEEFGFTSGEELVRFLAVIDPPKVAIEAATDVIMLERHGDLVDPDQLERAADTAIHNEFRAKAIRMELKALSKLANAPKYNITRAVARAVAERVVASVQVGNLKPYKYTVAAARLGRESKKALGEGDIESAALRKREQLVSLYVAKEMARAKRDVNRRRKALLRFNLKKIRKNLDAKDLVQIDAVLNRYQLRPMSVKELEEKQVLKEWLDDLADPDTLGVEPEVAEWLRNEVHKQHYSTLTFEEFLGLSDAVISMAHVARMKRKAFILEKNAVLAELAEAAGASVVVNAKREVPKRRAGLEQGSIKKLSAWWRGFRKEHRNFSSLLRQMDGNVDDGILWNLFLRPMNVRSDYQTEENAKSTLALSRLMVPILKGDRLGKKLHIAAVNGAYTREERIGVALNVGNAVNRERVLTGENWTEAQLQAVLDTLTKEEMDFVQAIWDYLDTFRPAIAEKELKLKGIEPDWVQAVAVQTRHGVYRGGYYPIRYDPERDTKAQAQAEADVQRQMRRGLVSHSYTRRGHLEARSESTGRPMRYDFVNTLTEHIEQVIHDLTWHEWLVDTSRILRTPAFKDAVLKHYGMEVVKELNGQIDAIAVGYAPAQTWFGKSLSHVRKGATVVGLGWRVTTALIQPLGLVQGMVRVGPKWVAQGMGEWLRDTASFENTYTRIKKDSGFMRMRPQNLMREVSEIRSRVRALSATKLFIQDTMFVFLVKMQLVADIPIWLGAYAKANAQPGADHLKSVALADQAVRDTQGSGPIADLATIQRKDEATKLWTNFMSFFIRTYNVTAEQTAATDFTKPAQVAGLMIDYLMLFTIPATLGFAMREALKGGDKDPEELVKGLIIEQITYMMGTMVLLRDIAGAFAGHDFRGPTGTRVLVDASRLIQQIAQGELDITLAKAFLAAGGTLLHIPTGQLITTLDGIVALMEGETESLGALIAGGPTR